jgi:cobalt/nickel transport system permease protein
MLPLPWAVHIADGVLSVPWAVAGFCGMIVLMLVACYRVRDEEIPRIALMTAAFFVASLIHIRVGPTSVHLLLNGLVGVVLGRRAGLAIPLGLFLQAALLGHGGFTSLGVNSCVMTIPALAAGAVSGLFWRVAARGHPVARAVMVFCSTSMWLLCLIFSASLLLEGRGTGYTGFHLGPPAALLTNEEVCFICMALAAVPAWLEGRRVSRSDFAPGLALGAFTVLGTVTLNAAVLLWGGAEDWHSIAVLVFVAHLPVAAVESIVMGFTLSYLGRVKPEMIGETPPRVADTRIVSAPTSSRAVKLPVALLLASLAGLAVPRAAEAHRLEAEYRVLPDGRLQVESWFDLTGDSPQGASVKVFQTNGALVAEGELDAKGLFSFTAERTEPLRVVVSAGAGHRKELLIPKDERARHATGDVPPETKPAAFGEETTFADRSPRVAARDVVAGIGFLLGLAAFVLSLRNARTLREMRQSR